MNFPDTWLDELRSRVDIVEVVSRYVRLQQKGKKHMGLCPFHGEKTPSFSVDSQMQLFYCFGCHKGGTAIHFLMDLERMTFPETVAMLAEQTGLDLPKQLGPPGISPDLKQRYMDANRSAARFYFDQLFTPEGGAARTYLLARGITDQTIRRFGLGAAINQRCALLTHLKTAGFTEDEAVAAGLCVRRDSGVFDMFRDRVMFPIMNAQGGVVGFGGRNLGDAQPKYINTSDTPVFNKRLGLYGLNLLAKQRGLHRLILVEGYMDVIALNQAGVEGVVATLGTALTPEQARLIKRYAPEVFICYDGDSAGRKAILRALDIFLEVEMPTRVLDIPGGMDPDDYIRAHGVDGFNALSPMPGTQFKLDRLREMHDMSNGDGRQRYAQDACAVIATLSSPVQRDDYLKQLSQDTGYAVDVLYEQTGALPKVKDTPIRRPRGIKTPPDQQQIRAESCLIAMLAKGFVPHNMVKPDDFLTPLYARAAQALLLGRTSAAILDELNDDERSILAGALEDLPLEADKQPEVMIGQCLQAIQTHRLNDELKSIIVKIKELPDGAEKTALKSRANALMKTIGGQKEWSV